MLDSQGHRIATFYDENRKYVPLDKISLDMQHAIVAIEDSRFYEHGALDIKGTIRALIVNSTDERRCPGWVVDHPAAGQADPSRERHDDRRAEGGV